MNRRSGGYRLPIPTDELVRLIEERAAKVDTYADLPEGIHGRTSLFPAQERLAGAAHYASASDPKSAKLSTPPSDQAEDGGGKLFTQSEKRK